jgi:hypothetical protein
MAGITLAASVDTRGRRIAYLAPAVHNLASPLPNAQDGHGP